MSEEKKKEKGEIVEGESTIDHFYHRHPLTLSAARRRSRRCYGCRRIIFTAETAYSCREGCSVPLLHEECAEMPREIRLSMHPHHNLIQKEVMYYPRCAVCERAIDGIGYYCSSYSCEFQVHVGCVQNMGVVPTSIDHPSHPHQLTSLWRPGRSCLSRCDACATIEKGSSYMCFLCQYWIHDTCATLPPTQLFHHHHHPLSLVYHLPQEYIKFDFKCDKCSKDLLPRYWAYHCKTCRYVVHIKCAIEPSSSTTTINIDANAAEDENLIVFPTRNPVEELIRSFVTKVGVAMANPNEVVNGKFKFHKHDHQLNLILVSPNDQQQEEEEEEEEEEDSYDNDDDDDGGGGGGGGDFTHGELVCDACTMPIFPNKQKSSVKYCNYYMSCGECKYFLHWACFHLPPEIHSHPLHLGLDHNLKLQTCPKLDFTYCRICGFHTNGLFYECTYAYCDFKADIKCLSLPNTIKHAAHPHHRLKLLNKETMSDDNYWQRPCGACGFGTYGDVCYWCEICKIILHSSCALLPAEVRNHEWDKHTLPLTFNASVDHPSGFYCDICEQEMNPKRWMYHCRTCDFSLHPRCHPPASGEYRNIKFGQRYDVASEHRHPLRYQLLSKKLHCDVCSKRKDYGSRGFQCTSHNCDFFMCLIPCGRARKDAMVAVD